MSYLEYISKTIEKDKTQELSEKNQTSTETTNKVEFKSNVTKGIDISQEKIQGTCYTMCPVDEEKLRIREYMVHVLEKCKTDRKLVKSYSRSAADSNMMVPKHLRPFHILQETVAYLLFEVSKRVDVPTAVVYDFINDRLRAVRQDMTIQRLSPQECAHLLEPMIRFYVYYGYRLHGLPLNIFDPVLHKKYLLECLKGFLSCWDNTNNLKDKGKENVTPAELGDLLETMNISHNSNKLACDWMLMESLYILCNLDDVHPLRRFINLPGELKDNHKMKLAFRIAVANRKGNFVQVTKMMSRLCPLSYCALCQYLPDLQRRALGILTLAYSNKSLCVPLAAVRRWLAFSNDAETLAACRHYGLAATNAAVGFQKGMLKTDVKMHESNIRLLNDGPDISMPHVFTYTTECR